MIVYGILACAALSACTQNKPSSTRDPAGLIPVFTNGTNGYRCFRIPAIVQAPDGALLAFAEARRNSCDDFGDVRIVLRASRDGGKTWSSLHTVASNGKLQAGNPVPVVDTRDPQYPHGRIFLIYTTSDAPELAVRNGQGVSRVWYRTTVDDGATWTEPVEITASVKPASWRNYGVGPGHGLQLAYGPHAGRILVAAYHTQGPARTDNRDVESHAIFSDDHGRTWSLGRAVARPGSNESTAAQNADGSVVLNSRDENGESHARILSISTDGGESWRSTFVAHDLPDPACEGSMVSYTSRGGKQVLLFSNSSSTVRDDRKDLTISVSTDGGRTWPKHTVLYDGAAAYSDLAVMPEDQVGILWERGNTGGIVFLILRDPYP